MGEKKVLSTTQTLGCWVITFRLCKVNDKVGFGFSNISFTQDLSIALYLIHELTITANAENTYITYLTRTVL